MGAEPTIRIMAVGDVMLGDSSHFLDRGVGTHIQKHGSDYPFSEVAPTIQQSDVFFANLESPASSEPGHSSWDKVYRASAKSLNGLKLATKNIMSLANNHILEHGPDVLEETYCLLKERDILAAGIAPQGGRERSAIHWEQNGLTFCLIADSLIKDRSGRQVDIKASTDWIVESLSTDKSDIRIVSLHWGDEYTSIPSDRQRQIGHKLVANGATLVLGHHPHVLQPVEAVGNSLIAYSLGNFVFDQDWTAATRGAGILDITLGRHGVKEWSFLPTCSDHECRPSFADGASKESLLTIIEGDLECSKTEYDQILRKSSLRHRLRMKLEMVQHFWRVKPATIHFLLTKRNRPKSASNILDLGCTDKEVENE